MQQTDEVGVEATGTGVRFGGTLSELHQHAVAGIPATDAQAASQLVADLWELSTQHLEPRFWPPSRRRYKRLLSDYCEVLPLVRREENRAYIIPTLVGLRHLREGNLSVSGSIVENIKFHTIPGEAILLIMRGLRSFVWQLLFFIYAIVPLVYLVFTLYIVASTYVPGLSAGGKVPSGTAPTPPPAVEDAYIVVAIAATSGIFGSVVSLLSRLSEFEPVSVRSHRFFFYTGATAPIVGGAFAVVVAALIKSKLIPFELASPYWPYIVVGFLSGFSERFSSSLLRLAQGRISSGDNGKNGSGVPGAGSRPGTAG